MPASRNSSSVRMWKKAARGSCEVSFSRSTTSEGIPCVARNMAVESPTSPPPEMRTCVWRSTVIVSSLWPERLCFTISAAREYPISEFHFAMRKLQMHRSTDRFLSTHTGSLPRPDDLIRLMLAREEGVPVDADALDARVRDAVDEMVRRQIEAGIDIVNDGEMSKPSYATYVK